MGEVISLEREDENMHLRIQSDISSGLKIDQSVAHNGACLTVTEVAGDSHTVTAIAETLRRTQLGKLQVGDEINLERCLKADARLDGHVVQGHVDITGTCLSVEEEGGSWIFRFSHPVSPEHLTVAKGSITINGVSLTVVDSAPDSFSVAIIPYTYEHTTFRRLRAGDLVNLEFDIVGKYVSEWLKRRGL